MAKNGRKANVIGVGMVPFAKPGKSEAYNVMGTKAARAALADAKVEYEAMRFEIRITINGVVSRIKILSNLKIDERRAPQDGRFKVEVGGQIYALRVSTLPSVAVSPSAPTPI